MEFIVKNTENKLVELKEKELYEAEGGVFACFLLKRMYVPKGGIKLIGRPKYDNA
jgi:hypothetical protein